MCMANITLLPDRIRVDLLRVPNVGEWVDVRGRWMKVVEVMHRPAMANREARATLVVSNPRAPAVGPVGPEANTASEPDPSA
jgi:hypothetical protein